MTALIEHANELGAAFPPLTGVPTTARRIATTKSKIANLWPPALIALGLVLTLTWNVGLVWLLYLLI